MISFESFQFYYDMCPGPGPCRPCTLPFLMTLSTLPRLLARESGILSELKADKSLPYIIGQQFVLKIACICNLTFQDPTGRLPSVQGASGQNPTDQHRAQDRDFRLCVQEAHWQGGQLRVP